MNATLIPTAASQPVAQTATKYFTLYHVELAAFLEDTDQALLIQQIHYWLQNENAGYVLRDGRRWIYNGYLDWIEQLFPWKSVSSISRMVTDLEQRGWITTKRFYECKREIGFIGKPPVAFQEDNQRKWYQLNYQRIYEDTGLDLLLGKAPPGEQPKRSRRANLQNCNNQLAEMQIPTCISENTSYIEDQSINQNISSDDQKEKIDSPVVESQESSNESTEPTTTSDNCQDFSQVVEDSQEVNHTTESSPVEVNIPRRPATKLNKRSKFEWEVEVNRPHSDFVRWRANTHYTPQGNHWAAGAISNAFSEIVNKSNNCPEKAQALWEQFLEYAKHSADTAQVRIDNGMEAWLPSCFDEKPQLDAQEVGKAVLAVKQQIQQEQAQALPASPQQQAQALPGQPAQEPEHNQGAPLSVRVRVRQILWQALVSDTKSNSPLKSQSLKDIERWAKETPGVVMTPEGPALAPEGESNVDTRAGNSSVSADSHQGAETPAAQTPKSPTLAQQVKCRRLIWGSRSLSPEVRQQIQRWAENTPGVVMTPDGPALE